MSVHRLYKKKKKEYKCEKYIYVSKKKVKQIRFKLC